MLAIKWFGYTEESLSKWLYFLGGVLSAEIVRQAFKLWKSTQKAGDIVENLRSGKVHEVLFFPDKAIACREFFDTVEGCQNQRCSFTHSITNLRKLLLLIRSARKSVDVCVYCISCFELANAVLQRHNVGVRVRVLTDISMEEAHGSQNPRFMKDGILVRTNRPPSLMHHKFVLIDDRIVAFGSFNWTIQAVTENNESILVTSDPATVRPFVSEFQRLWIEAQPRTRDN